MTFKIYSGTSLEAASASNTEAAAAIVLNGTVAEGVFTQADGETTGSADAYEDTAWHAQWNNLPKYTNAGALLYYVVKEDTVTNYATAYPSGQTYAMDAQLIENTELTEIEAVKNWVPATTASGDTVTFTLYADGVEKTTAVADGDTSNGAPRATGDTKADLNATEATEWTIKWSNLPKYKVDEGNVTAIAYTVEETSFTFGGVTYNVTKNGTDYMVTPVQNTVDEGETVGTWQTTAASDNTFTNELFGSVKVTKSFVFPENAGLNVPDTFKITASWTINEVESSIELTTTGTQPTNVILTGNGTTEPFSWTISNLPIGTEVTFTESGYEIAGYNVTTTVTPTDGKATASVTPGTVAITNEYVAGVELPSTGGPGTVIYTVSGLTLLLGASLILYYRRRRREQNT